MRNPKGIRWLVSTAALTLTAAIGVGQQAGPVNDAALTAPQGGEEWLSYNLTPQETRYSPLDQINASNAGRLGLSWAYDIGSSGGGQEATPLVHNGVMYSITNWSVVFAVDAKTGEERWRWDPEVNQETVRPKICCGVVNRGIAIYEGNIIAPIIDGRLIAIDAETGKPAWESRVAFSQENYTITMAPRIAKGKVIIGVSGAEFPVRGFFAAYDAKTGEFAWRFYTVPGDPSKPFENEAMRAAADTWSEGAWKLGGGGTVWDAIAYDPELELVYVGTGNAGPWPDELRGAEGKDALYACSILAVDVNTGELKWYFQMVPGDSWDYDSVQQLMLADLTIDGRERKVIMQANKNGFYYVIDRESGQFISGAPFAKLNWAKGLNEETGRPIVNEQAKYTADESVRIIPGPGGAHNWPPMSFNPNTGLVYIPGSSGGRGFTYAVAPEFEHQPGRMNLGVVFAPPPGAGGNNNSNNNGGNEDSPDAETAAAAEPAPPPPPKAVERPPLDTIGPDVEGGTLVAWDPVTQTERWRVPEGASIGGGTLTTSGNLVFQTIPNGKLFAYSADKGEKLLEIDTGLRTMAPPMTFLLDGKQYVAVMGGMTGAPTGFGGPPPSENESPRPGPHLLVFELDGKAPLPGSAEK